MELKANIANAFRSNVKPALILQCFALFIGLSYFYWPAAQPVFSYFAELKQQYGTWYSAVSTAIFGGLIPFAYLLVNHKIKLKPVQQGLFYLLFWALMGVLVDLFYQLQAYWFSTGTDWNTVLKKMVVDQFVYSAFFSAPILTISFLWKDNLFSWAQTYKKINARLFKLIIPTTIVTNWIIWIPSVLLIYMMPPNLQIPLFNLVLCFFVLLLSVLDRN